MSLEHNMLYEISLTHRSNKFYLDEIQGNIMEGVGRIEVFWGHSVEKKCYCSLVFNGYRISAWMIRKFKSFMDDIYTKLECIYLLPLNCTFKIN